MYGRSFLPEVVTVRLAATMCVKTEQSIAWMCKQKARYVSAYRAFCTVLLYDTNFLE